MTRPGQPSYGQVDPDYGLRLATTPADEDGPVWMVNLMSYRARAQYADGREDAITGREADDRYTPIGPLTAVGAEIVFHGEVETQLLGDQPQWDRIGVVRYPTRASFIEMQSRPDFQELHIHKEAGMAETIVMGCRPLFAGIPDGAPDWSAVAHPPTADDGPVVVLHVLRFHGDPADGITPRHMEDYQEVATRSAVAHGVHISGWFGVEGTIIGDGRAWHQVRFNTFPSRAAFMAVVADPERLEAQSEHREAAIADTYTIIVRPGVDRLAESIDEVAR